MISKMSGHQNVWPLKITLRVTSSKVPMNCQDIKQV